ncbi:Fosmidomycin resistance protein [Pectobacterium sp. F1-1]|nr:Fosmidomycin resistance protein [Pectobacterium sp. F1-1]
MNAPMTFSCNSIEREIAINLIMASAFASILIYAMELAPNRIGLVGGLFYGLSFGLAGI